MNAILIIIIICLSLHTLGFFKKLMQHCTLDTVPPLPEKKPEKAPAPPPNNNSLERRKLEMIATNIILYENGGKSNYNIWQQVKKLNDTELLKIINDFKSLIDY